MSTNEDSQIKRAVVFQEGENLRAVAVWSRDDKNALKLISLELEMRGADAMLAHQWKSHGFVMQHGAICGSSAELWLAYMLISCAERWFKEHV